MASRLRPVSRRSKVTMTRFTQSPSHRMASDSRQIHTIRLKIWDPASGQCLRTLKGHGNSVHLVAFSLDSKRLASGSSDDTLKIWDSVSGKYLQMLKDHSHWVYSIAFSPDGQRPRAKDAIPQPEEGALIGRATTGWC